MSAQAVRAYKDPGRRLLPGAEANGKRGALSYFYSFLAHGLVLMLVILLGGISRHEPPVDVPVMIEIGGGGGGGGGSSTMGENAGMVDDTLDPGVQQDNVKPIDNEPVTARTQDANNQRVPVDANARTDAANATNATRPQDASSRGQTQTGANAGTNGQGGGNGNGNGTGTGPGTGSGTGGGNGSGNGPGDGSGTGPGSGSGSGGGFGNFPAGTFNVEGLDCSKSDAGNTAGQSKRVTFNVTFKNNIVIVNPPNNTLKNKAKSVLSGLDPEKTYKAVVVCDCMTGTCSQQ